MTSLTDLPLVRILEDISRAIEPLKRYKPTLGMLIAKSVFSHVRQFDSTLRACVHEPVAALGVKLCSGDDLGQLLHVCGLDVHDVEALILYVEVPEVDSEIVAADERFPITVDRDAIDVVCMGIGVVSARDRSNHSIVMSEAREF